MKTYKLYYLIDPRSNSICYVGITKQTFNRRLSQHRNPKSTNMTPIAKLQRYLKKINSTLTGYVVNSTDCKKEIQELEIKHISEIGISNLKNIELGGYRNPVSSYSAKKAAYSRKKNGWIPRKGSELHNSKFNEKLVLKIYQLIKQYYTNYEIIQELDLNVGNTTIQSLRTGQNWNWLWKENFENIIPSFFMYKKGISPRIKLDIIQLIDDNTDKKVIINKYKELYPNLYLDYNRIINKKCWKKLWEYYSAYIK